MIVPDTQMRQLADCIAWMDADLDEHVSQIYKEQPLAQDWARVAKASEEVGEAIDALIGYTGRTRARAPTARRTTY